MKITLYELFSLCDIEGCDIADNEYDFVVYFGCKVKKGDCKDYYDRLMRTFSTFIECNHFDINDKIAHCDIAKFIDNHQDKFKQFMDKNNKKVFMPQSYSDIDNEDWYELYMRTFENLVIGNYSDEQYEELYNLFIGGK